MLPEHFFWIAEPLSTRWLDVHEIIFVAGRLARLLAPALWYFALNDDPSSQQVGSAGCRSRAR